MPFCGFPVRDADPSDRRVVDLGHHRRQEGQAKDTKMKEAFFGKKDDVSLARSVRLAVIQNQYAQGNLTETEAREILSGPLDPDDPTTIYDDSDCLVVLENFFEAVRNDPDITPEQKAYWAEIEKASAKDR